MGYKYLGSQSVIVSEHSISIFVFHQQLKFFCMMEVHVQIEKEKDEALLPYKIPVSVSTIRRRQSLGIWQDGLFQLSPQ